MVWRDKDNRPCRPVLGRHGDGGLLALGMVKFLCSLPVFSAGDVTSLKNEWLKNIDEVR